MEEEDLQCGCPHTIVNFQNPLYDPQPCTKQIYATALPTNAQCILEFVLQLHYGQNIQEVTAYIKQILIYSCTFVGTTIVYI